MQIFQLIFIEMLQINGVAFAVPHLEVYLEVLGVELESDFIASFEGKTPFNVVVGLIIAGVGKAVGWVDEVTMLKVVF